ncbi:unnamed protein product [Tuber aestivum]|uniref:Actin cortical patch SUR7/pH-response regulator PalI n=1 Tax=Tuber aestivum TaxID=59557 RepID=A0A292Q108_9PEZI|nr:unnamed protein product [Tuber aestivum]
MLNLTRFSRFGTGQCTKPIFLFSLVALSISLIFTSFLLTGSSTPSLRKFYLIELSYDTDTSSPSPVIANLTSLISSDRGNKTFSTIRVGYRSLCIDHNGDWECARDAKALNLTAKEVGGDPLELVAVADIYRKRISFSTPVWASLVVLGIAWIATAISCLPVIPVHPVFKKVAAGAAVLATVTLLGGMVLQNVTSTAVATLVNQLGLTAINVHLGNMIPAFGWSSFALTLLAAIGLAAVVVTEYTLEKTQEKVTRRAEEALSRGTGGRIGPAEVREWKNAVDSVNERGGSAGSDGGFAGRVGGGAVGRAGVVGQGVSLATNLMKKKMNGDGRPITGHNV